MPPPRRIVPVWERSATLFLDQVRLPLMGGNAHTIFHTGPLGTPLLKCSCSFHAWLCNSHGSLKTGTTVEYVKHKCSASLLPSCSALSPRLRSTVGVLLLPPPPLLLLPLLFLQLQQTPPVRSTSTLPLTTTLSSTLPMSAPPMEPSSPFSSQTTALLTLSLNPRLLIPAPSLLPMARLPAASTLVSPPERSLP